MKKFFLILSIFSLFLLFSFYPAFTKLIKIETAHFIIYYEEEIENLIDSSYINFMEQSYTFLSTLFDNNFKNKIYVYFSNREKVANGFNNPIGQSMIYIITTPPELSSSIGYMDEWLKLVFYHELTHQFSLTLKSKLGELLSYVFGNLFLGSYFNNPFYMIEGVTTSFEGRDFEIGRTYSPSIKQFIMQAIIDGNFKNPYELEQSYNDWPYQSAGYWYGGFFSKFLQQTYGMELYTQLWKKTASSSFEYALKTIYGKELLELWDEFYNWIKPKFEVYVNFEDCIKNSRKDILSNGRLLKIDDVAYYFYYNKTLNTIFKYNLETKKNDIVLENIVNFNSFELDQSSKNLILSYYDYKGSSLVIKSKIYNLEKKRFEKSILDQFESIREVSYFDENFIAIDLTRSFTDLVLIEKDGKKNIIIKGDKKFYISNPKQLDYKTIIFLGNHNANRSLYSYDLQEKKLTKLKLNANYIYQFNTLNGKIFFTYNDDYTLSKFGMINRDKEIHFDKNYSGGFTDPYYIDGKIIYLGSFSNKSLLLRIDINLDSPEEEKKLILKNENVNFVKIFNFDDSKNETITINQEESSKDNNKSNKSQVENKETNNNITQENKNNESDTSSLILKKNISIFPFNENLLPDFWLPSAGFYFEQFKSNYQFYLSGYGASVFWMEPITSSITNLGIYISQIEPFKLSFDFLSIFNYFYPFTFFFQIASYNLNNLLDDNENLSYLFFTNLNIYYEFISPISKERHLLNIGAFYRNNSNNNFIAIYFSYNYYKYLFNNSNLPFYVKNLLYFSNIDFSSDTYYKYELATAVKIKNLLIELKDNLALSKDLNLTNFGINEFYHFVLYEPVYELEYTNANINFNFINIVDIKGTIFETEKMGILNMIIPVGQLGLYIGYKFYLVSNLDLSSFNFNNIIKENVIYINLNLSFFGDTKLGFSASYIVSINEIYYYFYYTIQNPFDLLL